MVNAIDLGLCVSGLMCCPELFVKTGGPTHFLNENTVIKIT